MKKRNINNIRETPVGEMSEHLRNIMLVYLEQDKYLIVEGGVEPTFFDDMYKVFKTARLNARSDKIEERARKNERDILVQLQSKDEIPQLQVIEECEFDTFDTFRYSTLIQCQNLTLMYHDVMEDIISITSFVSKQCYSHDFGEFPVESIQWDIFANVFYRELVLFQIQSSIKSSYEHKYWKKFNKLVFPQNDKSFEPQLEPLEAVVAHSYCYRQYEYLLDKKLVFNSYYDEHIAPDSVGRFSYVPRYPMCFISYYTPIGWNERPKKSIKIAYIRLRCLLGRVLENYVDDIDVINYLGGKITRVSV